MRLFKSKMGKNETEPGKPVKEGKGCPQGLEEERPLRKEVPELGEVGK